MEIIRADSKGAAALRERFYGAKAQAEAQASLANIGAAFAEQQEDTTIASSFEQALTQKEKLLTYDRERYTEPIKLLLIHSFIHLLCIITITVPVAQE